METKDAGLWSITLRNKARDWISNVSAFFATTEHGLLRVNHFCRPVASSGNVTQILQLLPRLCTFGGAKQGIYAGVQAAYARESTRRLNNDSGTFATSDSDGDVDKV